MKLRVTNLAGGIALAAVLGTGLGAPALAGPNIAWSQLQVDGGRIACRDRAAQGIQAARQWRVIKGRQHAQAQDDVYSTWVRCWGLPGGSKSIATIVVIGPPGDPVPGKVRDTIKRYLRGGGQPPPPGGGGPPPPPGDPLPDPGGPPMPKPID